MLPANGGGLSNGNPKPFFWGSAQPTSRVDYSEKEMTFATIASLSAKPTEKIREIVAARIGAPLINISTFVDEVKLLNHQPLEKLLEGLLTVQQIQGLYYEEVVDKLQQKISALEASKASMIAQQKASGRRISKHDFGNTRIHVMGTSDGTVVDVLPVFLRMYNTISMKSPTAIAREIIDYVVCECSTLDYALHVTMGRTRYCGGFQSSELYTLLKEMFSVLLNVPAQKMDLYQKEFKTLTADVLQKIRKRLQQRRYTRSSVRVPRDTDPDSTPHNMKSSMLSSVTQEPRGDSRGNTPIPSTPRDEFLSTDEDIDEDDEDATDEDQSEEEIDDEEIESGADTGNGQSDRSSELPLTGGDEMTQQAENGHTSNVESVGKRKGDERRGKKEIDESLLVERVGKEKGRKGRKETGDSVQDKKAGKGKGRGRTGEKKSDETVTTVPFGEGIGRKYTVPARKSGNRSKLDEAEAQFYRELEDEDDTVPKMADQHTLPRRKRNGTANAYLKSLGAALNKEKKRKV